MGNEINFDECLRESLNDGNDTLLNLEKKLNFVVEGKKSTDKILSHLLENFKNTDFCLICYLSLQKINEIQQSKIHQNPYQKIEALKKKISLLSDLNFKLKEEMQKMKKVNKENLKKMKSFEELDLELKKILNHLKLKDQIISENHFEFRNKQILNDFKRLNEENELLKMENKNFLKILKENNNRMGKIEEENNLLMSQLGIEEEVRKRTVKKVKKLNSEKENLRKKLEKITTKKKETEDIIEYKEFYRFIAPKIKKIIENSKKNNQEKKIPHFVFCDHCGVAVHGKKKIIDHFKLNSKKHQKNIIKNLKANIPFNSTELIYCEYCDSDHTLSHFKQHLDTETHKNNELSSYKIKSREKYLCSFCGERFNSEKGILLHFQKNFDTHIEILGPKLQKELLEYSKKEKNSINECLICFENKKDILFQNCKHCCCCEECSKNLSNCPICRQPISEKYKIYL